MSRSSKLGLWWAFFCRSPISPAPAPPAPGAAPSPPICLIISSRSCPCPSSASSSSSSFQFLKSTLPRLLQFCGEKSVPVRSFLCLFQHKRNLARANSILGFLRINFFEELHLNLMFCLVCAPTPLKYILF